MHEILLRLFPRFGSLNGTGEVCLQTLVVDTLPVFHLRPLPIPLLRAEDVPPLIKFNLLSAREICPPGEAHELLILP
jgi:hypothetical protein